MLRISKMSVYRAVSAGQLPAVRLGRSVRVPVAAVHRLLEEAGA